MIFVLLIVVVVTSSVSGRLDLRAFEDDDAPYVFDACRRGRCGSGVGSSAPRRRWPARRRLDLSDAVDRSLVLEAGEKPLGDDGSFLDNEFDARRMMTVRLPPKQARSGLWQWQRCRQGVPGRRVRRPPHDDIPVLFHHQRRRLPFASSTSGTASTVKGFSNKPKSRACPRVWNGSDSADYRRGSASGTWWCRGAEERWWGCSADVDDRRSWRRRQRGSEMCGLLAAGRQRSRRPAAWWISIASGEGRTDTDSSSLAGGVLETTKHVVNTPEVGMFGGLAALSTQTVRL